ncbi:MAG: TFIIB-type zinc finger domain-containing protein [Faecalibacterium sp.]
MFITKQFICKNCGASDFYDKDGFRICKYCNSKFIIETQDVIQKGSSIALNDDIQMLLNKCRQDPWNARRYANLILDIDPQNRDAIKYL